MNVFLLSDQCGHCVRHERVPEKSGVAAVCEKAVGTACGLCGARVREHDDLTVIVLDSEVGITRRTAGVPEALEGLLARPDRYEALSKALAGMEGPSLARKWYDQRNWDKAVTWSERAAEALEDPTERARSYLLLAVSQRGRGDLVQAEVAFRCALDCGSSVAGDVRSMVALQLGNLRRDSGHDPRAREAYRQAFDLSVQPASTLAAMELGLLEERAGNRLEAMPFWEYAYQNAPRKTRPLAAYHLGMCWERRGGPEASPALLPCGDLVERDAGARA